MLCSVTTVDLCNIHTDAATSRQRSEFVMCVDEVKAGDALVHCIVGIVFLIVVIDLEKVSRVAKRQRWPWNTICCPEPH